MRNFCAAMVVSTLIMTSFPILSHNPSHCIKMPNSYLTCNLIYANILTFRSVPIFCLITCHRQHQYLQNKLCQFRFCKNSTHELWVDTNINACFTKLCTGLRQHLLNNYYRISYIYPQASINPHPIASGPEGLKNALTTSLYIFCTESKVIIEMMTILYTSCQ